MVRAFNATRLSADTLAQPRKRSTWKLTYTQQHAVSFIGSACVLGGILTSLLLCTPDPGQTSSGAVRPVLVACSGLLSGRPCQQRGEHALPIELAAFVPSDDRRGHL